MTPSHQFKRKLVSSQKINCQARIAKLIAKLANSGVARHVYWCRMSSKILCSHLFQTKVEAGLDRRDASLWSSYGASDVTNKDDDENDDAEIGGRLERQIGSVRISRVHIRILEACFLSHAPRDSLCSPLDPDLLLDFGFGFESHCTTLLDSTGTLPLVVLVPYFCLCVIEYRLNP